MPPLALTLPMTSSKISANRCYGKLFAYSRSRIQRARCRSSPWWYAARTVRSTESTCPLRTYILIRDSHFIELSLFIFLILVATVSLCSGLLIINIKSSQILCRYHKHQEHSSTQTLALSWTTSSQPFKDIVHPKDPPYPGTEGSPFLAIFLLPHCPAVVMCRSYR